MADVNRVLVVGAGIGGLGAAAALGQRGIEVEVIERMPEPNVFGVGINQPGNSLRALNQIGVLDEIREAGFEFDRWAFHDKDGNMVVEVPTRLGGDGIPPNCALPRPELHRILIGAAERSGARIRYGVTVSEVADEGERVEVKFSDGSEGSYDLVAAYDGVKSDMRRRLFGGEFKPAYTGYAVWRVTVSRPPEIDYGALYQSPFHKGGWIPLTERTMYLLLVSREPEGVHYDEEKFTELLRERLAEFGGVIGEIRDNLDQYEGIVYAPLIEVMLPAPWHRGRVVVLGDGAHACVPHTTQGAAMALEDAVVLADELGDKDSVADALDALSERRYPRAKLVQDVSRGILESEMAINEETLKGALAHMAEELPGQFEQFEGFLNQPA
jgi:2-polyprenyl-6-methoxyphenol hydroxylase-like FAD-dependent oxidoreductase